MANQQAAAQQTQTGSDRKPTIMEELKGVVSNMQLSSPAVVAQVALGLEELRSALHPNSQQVGQQSVPGLWGVPTTGEQTAARMEGEQQPASNTFEVPNAGSLGQLKAEMAQHAPEVQHSQQQEQGRGR